jgi:hypothetical protein
MHGRTRASRTVGERRRDRLIREREHDPYKLRKKLPDPASCPDCGAIYRAGRWQWGSPDADHFSTLCPACCRIRDGYPAGFVTLSGPFAAAHRREIMHLARHLEEREKSQHPFKRIIEASEINGDWVITTTDSSLARSIGDALHRAYKGELNCRFADEADAVRVTWRR